MINNSVIEKESKYYWQIETGAWVMKFKKTFIGPDEARRSMMYAMQKIGLSYKWEK